MGGTVSVLATVALVVPAVAQSSTTAADQCYVVVQNVSTVLNTMHDISDKREKVYNDAATRVAGELKTAKDAGYDTAQLQTDYNTLGSDISQFQADRQTLEADLTNALSVSQTGCGAGTGQFAAATQTARAQLAVVRADDVKVRVDIRQKLISDVRAYVTWLKSKTTPTGATFN